MTKIILIVLSLMLIYLNYKENKDKIVGFYLFVAIFFSLDFFLEIPTLMLLSEIGYIAFHIWLMAFWIILLFGCILAVQTFRKKSYIETAFSVITIVAAVALILSV